MRPAKALALFAVLMLFGFVPSSDAAGRRHVPHHGLHHHRGFHHRHHGFHHHRFHHHGVRTRVFIGFGPTYAWGYYAPQPLAVQQPAIYVQHAPPAPLEPGYWYYCQSAGAYYPTAPSCPEAWVKVPPRLE